MNEIAIERPLGSRMVGLVTGVFTAPARLMRAVDGSQGQVRDALLLAGGAMLINAMVHLLLHGDPMPALLRLPYLVGMGLFYVLVLHLLAIVLLQSRVSASATLTAVCYAMAPSALLALPYVGYAALAWFYVLVFLAARELYRAGNGRALVLLVLFALAGVVLETALARAGLGL